MRIVLLAGVAALALSACASNRASMSDPIETGSISSDPSALGQLAARYKAHPNDKRTIIYYSAALRAAGQAEQAVSVLEAGQTIYKNDLDIKIAYSKALTAAGRALAATGSEEIGVALAPTVAGLDPAQRAQLASLLETARG